MNVRKVMMWALVFVLGVLVLGAILPANAQAVTPEAVATAVSPLADAPLPDADTSVVTALIALLGVALVVFGALIAWALHLGYNSLPKWAQELVIENREYIYGRVDEGFDLLDTAAQRTPTDLDDRIAEIARREAGVILDKAIPKPDAPPTDEALARVEISPGSFSVGGVVVTQPHR